MPVTHVKLQDLWTSVFGASVSNQISQRISSGLGPPSEDQMVCIMNEAIAQADFMVETLENRLDDVVRDRQDANLLIEIPASNCWK